MKKNLKKLELGRNIQELIQNSKFCDIVLNFLNSFMQNQEFIDSSFLYGNYLIKTIYFI